MQMDPDQVSAQVLIPRAACIQVKFTLDWYKDFSWCKSSLTEGTACLVFSLSVSKTCPKDPISKLFLNSCSERSSKKLNTKQPRHKSSPVSTRMWWRVDWKPDRWDSTAELTRKLKLWRKRSKGWGSAVLDPLHRIDFKVINPQYWLTVGQQTAL